MLKVSVFRAAWCAGAHAAVLSFHSLCPKILLMELSANFFGPPRPQASADEGVDFCFVGTQLLDNAIPDAAARGAAACAQLQRTGGALALVVHSSFWRPAFQFFSRPSVSRPSEKMPIKPSLFSRLDVEKGGVECVTAVAGFGCALRRPAQDARASRDDPSSPTSATKSAKSGHYAARQNQPYWITSSAATCSVCGTVMPSAMMRVSFGGCSIVPRCRAGQ